MRDRFSSAQSNLFSASKKWVGAESGRRVDENAAVDCQQSSRYADRAHFRLAFWRAGFNNSVSQFSACPHGAAVDAHERWTDLNAFYSALSESPWYVHRFVEKGNRGTTDARWKRF